MARAKKPHGDVKRSRKKISVLDRLKPGEAETVLRRLLAVHPDLADEAEQIARSVLGEVSFESVAEEVEHAVRSLDLDDLNSRAGSHAWGYTEPSEAAWELLGEAVDPFLDDMQRQVELRLEAEALEICKGVVLGLYRLRKGAKGDGLVGWAPDFPAETAAHAVHTWRTGGDTRKRVAWRGPRKRPGFPQDFVEKFVPEWGSLIGRTLSRT
jgi:hypothetical protein